MRPRVAPDGNIVDFYSLLHPGVAFEHPRDAVSHPGLSISEKRAILASWAPAATAIAWCAPLRASAGLKAPVTTDEILEALCSCTAARGNCMPASPSLARVRPSCSMTSRS